jgi:hypothetical protein
MVSQYGRGSVKREESRLAVGGRELAGTTLRVSFAGTGLTQAIYSFPAGKGSVVLLLQDCPQEDGNESAEFARALGMLRTTFEFPADAR